MSKKGKIERIERVETGRFVQGTNFVKGDFIPMAVSFIVHVIGEAAFEVSREKLLSSSPGRERITDSFLDSFKGKDANTLRGK